MEKVLKGIKEEIAHLKPDRAEVKKAYRRWKLLNDRLQQIEADMAIIAKDKTGTEAETSKSSKSEEAKADEDVHHAPLPPVQQNKVVANNVSSKAPVSAENKEVVIDTYKTEVLETGSKDGESDLEFDYEPCQEAFPYVPIPSDSDGTEETEPDLEWDAQTEVKMAVLENIKPGEAERALTLQAHTEDEVCPETNSEVHDHDHLLDSDTVLEEVCHADFEKLCITLVEKVLNIQKVPILWD